MAHTFKITAELAKRITQGIADAQRQIDREMKYAEEFRDMSLIAENQAHIEKMNHALSTGFLTA